LTGARFGGRVSSSQSSRLVGVVGIGYTTVMTRAAKPTDLWVGDPEDHDFPAARDYLSLMYLPEVAEALAEALRAASTIRTYKAKVILRASGLRPLGQKDFHVRADLDKITKGEKLSPVLLVRDAARAVLVIADGFHRVCASRVVDEDLIIPCRIVTAP
jgi:hypothetical protein